jgi:hypothetical protein
MPLARRATDAREVAVNNQLMNPPCGELALTSYKPE